MPEVSMRGGPQDGLVLSAFDNIMAICLTAGDSTEVWMYADPAGPMKEGTARYRRTEAKDSSRRPIFDYQPLIPDGGTP